MIYFDGWYSNDEELMQMHGYFEMMGASPLIMVQPYNNDSIFGLIYMRAEGPIDESHKVLK